MDVGKKIGWELLRGNWFNRSRGVGKCCKSRVSVALLQNRFDCTCFNSLTCFVGGGIVIQRKFRRGVQLCRDLKRCRCGHSVHGGSRHHQRRHGQHLRRVAVLRCAVRKHVYLLKFLLRGASFPPIIDALHWCTCHFLRLGRKCERTRCGARRMRLARRSTHADEGGRPVQDGVGIQHGRATEENRTAARRRRFPAYRLPAQDAWRARWPPEAAQSSHSDLQRHAATIFNRPRNSQTT